MPWEKQFDVDGALERAMALFWARGFDATSVRDLVEGMGVNRGSLYDTFGGKRALFIRALMRYQAEREAWLEALASERRPREAIAAVFERALEEALGAHGDTGCFLVNTAVERSPHDPEIAALVADGLGFIERYFRRLICAGQRQGELSAELDASARARALLGLLTGLRVLARSRPEAPLLRAIAREAQSLLR